MQRHGRAAVETLAHAEHVGALPGRELHGNLVGAVEVAAIRAGRRSGARGRGRGHKEEVVVLRERVPRRGRIGDRVRLLVVQVGRLIRVAVGIVGRKRETNVCATQQTLSAKRCECLAEGGDSVGVRM